VERLEILEREIKLLVFDQNGTIVDMQKGLRACPGPKRNLGLRLGRVLIKIPPARMSECPLSGAPRTQLGHGPMSQKCQTQTLAS
jgi:hypothetical protein